MDLRQNVRRGFGFWGLVGVVMTALKLKEHLDEHYDRVPTDEEGLGHGPVALQSSMGDEDALREGLLDTEIPATRSRKKRTADCCVCCGMRCGLFWKAFGIVCLLAVGWQAIKLAMWAMTPAKTGLESMPEYSKSLGCASASYILNGEKTTYTVPFNALTGDHSFNVRGRSAVGTILIVEGASNATEVKYEMTLRTDDQTLLDNVSMSFPSSDEVEDGTTSRVQLTTPNFRAESCMRYDITMYVPPAIKTMHLEAHALAQIKFDTDSVFEFDSLFVTMYTLDEKNMLLPHSGVHANKMSLDVTRGWLVGDVAIVDSTSLSTQRGDAVMNVHVRPAPSSEEPPATATLLTTSGAGRSDVFYINHPGHPHRPISSKHLSQRNADVYLTYKEAEFSGLVNFQAKSYSVTGLQGSIRPGTTTDLPWVGDKEGADRLEVASPSGWVGLYF